MLSKLLILGIVKVDNVRGILAMKKGFISIILVTIALIFSGCASAEETIYESLEEVVKKEKDFEDQQKPLAEGHRRQRRWPPGGV